MTAASSGCWWVEGVRQPSPQVKDQAPGNDDAQEKDEGQPGLHKGPKTAREERMVRGLWARNTLQIFYPQTQMGLCTKEALK